MSQRTPPTTRLHTAAEWCRSPDPLTRIQGLELAAGLGREGREMVLRALADNELLVRRRPFGWLSASSRRLGS
ncbi:MAG: hypothetical protein IPF66_20835 [Holophagales bacterium]|nr:hypothetical protein [Holophagales bacterium]